MKGHVYLEGGKPFMTYTWGGELWKFYWHPDQHWVSLSRVSEIEALKIPNNQTKGQQQYYHDKHAEYNKQFEKGDGK